MTPTFSKFGENYNGSQAQELGKKNYTKGHHNKIAQN